MEVFKVIQSASNVDVTLRQQLQKLPNGQEILKFLDQSNGNYEQAAMAYMQSIGIGMNDLVKVAKSAGF